MTKLTSLANIKVGDTVVRSGNDGDIFELVVGLRKLGAYIFYTVECSNKTYEMSGRLSSIIRVVI